MLWMKCLLRGLRVSPTLWTVPVLRNLFTVLGRNLGLSDWGLDSTSLPIRFPIRNVRLPCRHVSTVPAPIILSYTSLDVLQSPLFLRIRPTEFQLLWSLLGDRILTIHLLLNERMLWHSNHEYHLTFFVGLRYVEPWHWDVTVGPFTSDGPRNYDPSRYTERHRLPYRRLYHPPPTLFLNFRQCTHRVTENMETV